MPDQQAQSRTLRLRRGDFGGQPVQNVVAYGLGLRLVGEQRPAQFQEDERSRGVFGAHAGAPAPGVTVTTSSCTSTQSSSRMTLRST